jgi:hypothetical protein
MSLSSHQSSFFKLLPEVTVLPYHPTPPVFCVGLPEHFMIVGRHEAQAKVMLTLLDLHGRLTTHQSLPVMFVEGLMTCPDEIHLWGSDGASLSDLLLNQAGQVVAESFLPVDQDILFMPQMICGQGVQVIFWIDGQGQLQLRQENQSHTIHLSDRTLGLTGVMTATGLTLLRLVGIPGYLEMLHVVNGRLQHSSILTDTNQAYSPLLFWQEDHYLLLWLSRPSRSLQLQKFAPDFSLLAPAQTLLTLDKPETFRWLRARGGHNSEIILAWRIEQPGERLNELGQPLPDLRQTLATLDSTAATVIGATAVPYAAESYFTGCQSGSKLLLIMGGGEATVLVYELS